MGLSFPYPSILLSITDQCRLDAVLSRLAQRSLIRRESDSSISMHGTLQHGWMVNIGPEKAYAAFKLALKLVLQQAKLDVEVIDVGSVDSLALSKSISNQLKHLMLEQNFWRKFVQNCKEWVYEIT